MNKVMIISSSLRHGCQYVDPHINKLKKFLDKKVTCDVYSAYGLDISILKDYDTIVFAFSLAASTIPSSTLELLDDLSKLDYDTKSVYAMICNDELETDKCDYAERVIEIFCEKHDYDFLGSLKMGSLFLVNKVPHSFILTSYIKKFAMSIISNKQSEYAYTYSSKANFMIDGNRYWKKQVKGE